MMIIIKNFNLILPNKEELDQYKEYPIAISLELSYDNIDSNDALVLEDFKKTTLTKERIYRIFDKIIWKIENDKLYISISDPKEKNKFKLILQNTNILKPYFSLLKKKKVLYFIIFPNLKEKFLYDSEPILREGFVKDFLD